MTTLLMGDEWKDRDEKRCWMRAHKFISSALDIGDRKDCSIILRKGGKGRRGERGFVMRYPLISKKDYFVTLFDADPISMMAAYAHEKVHVKQYLKGELGDCEIPNYTIWNGQPVKDVPMPCRNAFEEMMYMNLPWEKEAFERMEPLTQAAITALPREDQEWLKSHYKVMEDA